MKRGGWKRKKGREGGEKKNEKEGRRRSGAQSNLEIWNDARSKAVVAAQNNQTTKGEKFTLLLTELTGIGCTD